VAGGRTPLNRLASERRLGVRRRDLPGLVSSGFSPLPHAGYEKSEADTHVEFFDDVLSDAGSTPAASTIYLVLRQRLADSTIYRLHNVSKPVRGFGLIEETDRTFDRCGTQMHVPLRGGEVHVAR